MLVNFAFAAILLRTKGNTIVKLLLNDDDIILCYLTSDEIIIQ